MKTFFIKIVGPVQVKIHCSNYIFAVNFMSFIPVVAWAHNNALTTKYSQFKLHASTLWNRAACCAKQQYTCKQLTHLC